MFINFLRNNKKKITSNLRFLSSFYHLARHHEIIKVRFSINRSINFGPTYFYRKPIFFNFKKKAISHDN